ncbi:MAG: hypothetical protein VKJ24_00355 [Synechococcales bacterium]|nr:hypothetical protein [Synechococcales bacterium]
MKTVLELVRQREEEFAQLPFFQFLRDTSIDPYQRMSWFPCLAHFAMSFKDLNNDVLKDDCADHPLQQMINQHSIEDGSHWRWYLKDLQSLGIDRRMLFSEFLRFMWGDETLKVRRLSNNLVAMCRYQEDPVLKLAVIEAIEATGTPALSTMALVSEELRAMTNQRYFYFSPHHVKVETGHIQSGMEYDETEAMLLKIEMTPEQEAKAFELVDYVFDSFTEAMEGLMEFVQKHTFDELKTPDVPNRLHQFATV